MPELFPKVTLTESSEIRYFFDTEQHKYKIYGDDTVMNNNSRHSNECENAERDSANASKRAMQTPVTAHTYNLAKQTENVSVDNIKENFQGNFPRCVNKTAEKSGIKVNSDREREILARKAVNIIYCSVFVLFIIAMCVMVCLHLTSKNKPTYSEYEKRNLESAPELTLTSLADGSFTDSFDRFYSDNFPMREKLVESATFIKRFRGMRAFNSEAKQVIQGDDDIYSSGDLEISVDEDKFVNATQIQIDGIDTESENDLAVEEQEESAEMQEGISDATDTPEYSDEMEIQPDIVTDSETQSEPSQDAFANSESAIQEKVEPAVPTGEKRDTIYLIGDTAYEYFRGSEKTSNDYINVINTYAKYIPEGVNIYDLVVPTHPEFGLEGADRTVSKEQKPVIDYIGNNLDSRVNFVNPYDKLYSNYKNGEYLYFRTDHHWTIRGAYRAYEAFCESAGIVPIPEETYEKGRIEPFLGTFYSASGNDTALKNNPDYVEYFKIDTPCTVLRYDTKGKATSGKLYYTSVKGQANSYLAFMGGDFAYVNIKTENKNGRKLMIFKESFGNPLIGLLVPHFEEVHVADIRYFRYNSINFISQYGITDVLFCNGIMSANSKSRVNDLLGLMNK